jgi:hypothetical protein
VFTVTRVTEQDWRSWREIRLAALAEAPDAFADTLSQAEALPDDDWREMTRTGAIFIATAGDAAAVEDGPASGGGPASEGATGRGGPAGVVAGLPGIRRPSGAWAPCGSPRRGAAAGPQRC